MQIPVRTRRWRIPQAQSKKNWRHRVRRGMKKKGKPARVWWWRSTRMRRRKRKRRGEENGLDLRLRPLSSSPFLAASENDITTKMAAIFHLSSVRVVVNAFFTSFFSFTFPPQTSWSFSMAFLFDSVSRDRSPVQYRRVVFPIFFPNKILHFRTLPRHIEVFLLFFFFLLPRFRPNGNILLRPGKNNKDVDFSCSKYILFSLRQSFYWPDSSIMSSRNSVKPSKTQ